MSTGRSPRAGYPSTWHVLSDIDPRARTATCQVCGPVDIRRRNAGKHQRWRCAVKSNALEQAYYAGNPERREKKAARALGRIRQESHAMYRSASNSRRRRSQAIALDLVAQWIDQVPISRVQQATRIDGAELRGVANELGYLASTLHRRAARLRREGRRAA